METKKSPIKRSLPDGVTYRPAEYSFCTQEARERIQTVTGFWPVSLHNKRNSGWPQFTIPCATKWVISLVKNRVFSVTWLKICCWIDQSTFWNQSWRLLLRTSVQNVLIHNFCSELDWYILEIKKNKHFLVLERF